ncbi:TorD/DmsD family molecular chaperone [Paracoccus sanguinis]|uniref:TorD/DmsD family molecular chaperone n=1 Tax=Paracoccus sanguinis TaxID=1545044 RepID=UPI00145244C4|nr:molecular chaperone TorD family protein [Paracoccus sanguinis]QJD16596.1 hypothetical protein HGN31_06630 [Paracoccus sanguinis]
MAETTKAATHDCGCGADHHHHGPADESARPEPAKLSAEGQAALTAAAEALGLIIRLHDREPDAALVRGLKEAEAPALFAAILAGEDGQTAAAALAEALDALPDDSTEADMDLVAAAWAEVHITHGLRASPNGSVWMTVESLERQEPMFAVRDWYEHYGLSTPDWRRRSDDNIVHELQFVQHLLGQGTQVAAVDAGRFMDLHVLPWVPEWGRRVAARAAEPLVAASGLLTATYLEGLRELIAQVSGVRRGPVAPLPQAQAVTPDEPERFIPGVAESW